MSREEVAALVFGPGLPPGGARGTLSVSSLGIEVMADGIPQRADLASVTLRKIGFEKSGLEIAWQEAGEIWAAHVLDHLAAQRLLSSTALAGTTQGRQQQATQRRGSVARSVGWTALVLFVLLPVVLLAVLILNAAAVAGWIAASIPVEQEMRLGRQAFAGMRSSLQLKDEGPAYEAVQTIVLKLTADSQYRYDVHIAEDPSLNAFAMPGGVIVVHTGLIAATKRQEELAGVLAHEVQHVELRHSLRGMIKDLGLRGLWAFVTGDIGGTLGGQAALELTSLKFSRDDETEADLVGFDALVKAGIDPSGMPAFFKTMSDQAADAPVALISTHPLSAERHADLTTRVAGLGERSFAPLAFGSWPPK